MNKKQSLLTIAIVLAVWNGIGILIGALDSDSERRGDFIASTKDVPGHWEAKHNGCIYKSFSSFTNLGYVFACELFRKRFEYEGIEKVGGK